MLYSFSQANYGQEDLQCHLSHLCNQDAVILWQDGVLLPLKQPPLWQNLPCEIFVLDIDLQARGVQSIISAEKFKIISLTDLVKLSEKYFPQFAL